MDGQIEVLEPRWTSPEANEFFDMLQRRIAEEFALPRHLVGAPSYAIEDFKAKALEATEFMRKQAADLYALHAAPQIMIRR